MVTLCSHSLLWSFFAFVSIFGTADAAYYYRYTYYRYYYYYYYYNYYSYYTGYYSGTASSAATVGVIVGVVFTIIFLTALIIGLACYCRIRRQRRENAASLGHVISPGFSTYTGNVGPIRLREEPVGFGCNADGTMTGEFKGYSYDNPSPAQPNAAGPTPPPYEAATAESADGTMTTGEFKGYSYDNQSPAKPNEAGLTPSFHEATTAESLDAEKKDLAKPPSV